MKEILCLRTRTVGTRRKQAQHTPWVHFQQGRVLWIEEICDELS